MQQGYGDFKLLGSYLDRVRDTSIVPEQPKYTPSMLNSAYSFTKNIPSTPQAEDQAREKYLQLLTAIQQQHDDNSDSNRTQTNEETNDNTSQHLSILPIQQMIEQQAVSTRKTNTMNGTT